jgi:beta-lactamase class A
MTAIDRSIAAIAGPFSGRLGITALNLTTSERYEHNAEESFYPASTCKLPILYEVFHGALQGRWNLSDTKGLTPADRVEGSGVLQHLTPGLMLTLRDLAMLMIIISDNVASNILLDLCTPDAVNRAMQDLAIEGVRVNRKIGVDLQIPMGEATPRGMARLMALIAEEKVLNAQSCAEMISILQRQQFKELTSRYIPETDAEDDQPLVRIASKNGWVRGVRNDVALIFTPQASYVLSLFSGDCRDRRFYSDNEGMLTLARISQVFYEAWGR